MWTRPWAQPAQPANLLHFDLVSWPQRVLPAWPPPPPPSLSAVLVPAQAQAPWQPWGHQPLLYGGCRRAGLLLPTALPGPNMAPAQPGLPTAQPSLSPSWPPVPGAGAALVPCSCWDEPCLATSRDTPCSWWFRVFWKVSFGKYVRNIHYHGWESENIVLFLRCC